MVKISPLDHKATAKTAWARYRRLMIGMSILTLLAVLAAIGWLAYELGDQLTIHMVLATAAGVGFSVMLAAALMGLVFLSSGSGHDETIDDPFESELDKHDSSNT